MVQSSITARYRTTIPKEVRENLGVRPHDVLQWEIVDGYVRVRAAGKGFLERREAIRVGAGSTVEDVRRARSRRGVAPE